jgi:methylthioribose-1-phosphate isomerase
MAILSNGEIISEGNPTELVATIDGKIWTRIIPKRDIEIYKKAFDVISTKLVSGETQIRVLSENKPEAGFEKIVPNLEDFYFATLFNHTNKKA